MSHGNYGGSGPSQYQTRSAPQASLPVADPIELMRVQRGTASQEYNVHPHTPDGHVAPVYEDPHLTQQAAASPGLARGATMRGGAVVEEQGFLRTTTVGKMLSTFVGASAFDPPVYLNQMGPKDMSAEEFQNKQAADEHKDLKDVGITLCTSPKDMIVTLGRGVFWYFTFVKYIWIINLILTFFALFNVIPHLSNVMDRPRSERPSFPTVFYLSEYDSDVKGYWLASSILSVIVLFFLGPIYRQWIRWEKGKRQRQDPSYVEDPFEGLYQVDTDEAVDKIDYTAGQTPGRKERSIRRLISLFIFVAILTVSGVVNYNIQRQARDEGSGSNAATLIALIIVAVNLAFQFGCEALTKFERHLYKSDARRWTTLKVFVFKISNVLVLYFVKRYELEQNSDLCPLETMANQFWVLLLIDIFIMAFIQIAYPLIWNCLCKKRAERTEHANEAVKPPFLFSDEYIEVIYRQFIVGLGVFVIPALPALALVGNVLEYWQDKYIMLRLCQRPARTNITFENVLMFCFFVLGLGVTLGYPNGAIWVLSGSAGLSDNEKCTIFQ